MSDVAAAAVVFARGPPPRGGRTRAHATPVRSSSRLDLSPGRNSMRKIVRKSAPGFGHDGSVDTPGAPFVALSLQRDYFAARPLDFFPSRLRGFVRDARDRS